MSDTTDTPTPESTQPLDHRQCRHLKMNGVRCGRTIPLGHTYCYHHRNNRDPSFVFHHGKRRVPLLEDISALQVTATAAIHGLLNGAIDRRDARTVLYGVHVATGLLRFDLAEKRWFHQTGQTRPEPVSEFAVVGHEHLAIDDEQPAAHPAPNPAPCTPYSAPSPVRRPPCSTLDPEEDFYTPEVCARADSSMRVPLPPPGTRDPLGPDWPCPYRFEHCKGPGHAAACHYCTGLVHWADMHPGEPDPGAPGPLPTVNLQWSVVPQRDIGAPVPSAVCREETDCDPVAENPRAEGATLVNPARQREETPLTLPTTPHETLALPAPAPEPDTFFEPEPEIESDLLPMLVASAPIDVTNALQPNQSFPFSIPRFSTSVFPRLSSSAQSGTHPLR